MEQAPGFLQTRKLPRRFSVAADAFVAEELLVPPVSAIDTAQMPIIRAPGELLEEVETVEFNPSIELDNLTRKAFDALNHVFDLEMPSVHHDHFPAVLNAKMKASKTVLDTQVRVDENRLKKRADDRMGAVLDRLTSVMRTVPALDARAA
jgi:hypothetical protein